MRIYIVRHGETEENLSRILQGHMPGTLTEKGKKQMQDTAERIANTREKFTRVVTSDLKRAVDSAQIIADRIRLPIVRTEMLRERDWGKFTGIAIGEAREKFCADGKWAFPKGTVETEEAVFNRAANALEKLKQLYDGETIIVVTHGLFARNLIAAHFNCPTCEVVRFVNAEIRILDI